MQANERLFTDRPIHANLPADDAAGSTFETLAHAALMVILLGAFVLTGQQAGSTTASPASPAANEVVAKAAAPSPAPVVRNL